MPVSTSLSYRNSIYRSPLSSKSPSTSYRSTYDRNSTYSTSSYRPISSFSSSTLPSSYTSSHRPSCLLSLNSGSSSTPSSIQLTRYNHRRSSLDYNDDDFNSSSSSKSVSSSSYLSPFSRRKKYTLTDDKNELPSELSGLSNLGNTCYMNSILQSLYSTEIFREYLAKSDRGTLNMALRRLFEEINDSNNHTVNPSSFRNSFTRVQSKFRGYEQQDAQEFFQYLINALHDEVNLARSSSTPRTYRSPKSSSEAWDQYKSLENSSLVDMMAGLLSSTVTCSICGNSSICYDPFWGLSLPLPVGVRETNAEKCLKEFTALEELSRDELAKCERCNKPTKSTKRLAIEKAPPVLVLHLKRFSNEGYKLVLPKVIASERIFTKSKCYTLNSIVLHHGGSIRSGHYTSYGRHGSKWYHFNDERVSELKNFIPEDVEDAYILFYVESSISSRL
ncbi:ubiquitin carboxyl-terminal hydrolase 2-like isoform X1 [Brevipalpus obovatus]|uniref:ubiquitin carboxyl-terminal hydrolase 2-like isoform X1 n=1 Tax=Brevipalpus obovatus TaxID=246614 RepID=UPI003D9EA56C